MIGTTQKLRCEWCKKLITRKFTMDGIEIHPPGQVFCGLQQQEQYGREISWCNDKCYMRWDQKQKKGKR